MVQACSEHCYLKSLLKLWNHSSPQSKFTQWGIINSFTSSKSNTSAILNWGILCISQLHQLMVNNDICTALLLFRTDTQQPDHTGQRAASRDWQVRVPSQEHDNQQWAAAGLQGDRSNFSKNLYGATAMVAAVRVPRIQLQGNMKWPRVLG